MASTQFPIHVNESSTLQLINGISNDLQKLLKYFNGIAIFTPFKSPLLTVLPTKLDLHLNDEEFSTVAFALLTTSSF